MLILLFQKKSQKNSKDLTLEGFLTDHGKNFEMLFRKVLKSSPCLFLKKLIFKENGFFFLDLGSYFWARTKIILVKREIKITPSPPPPALEYLIFFCFLKS